MYAIENSSDSSPPQKTISKNREIMFHEFNPSEIKRTPNFSDLQKFYDKLLKIYPITEMIKEPQVKIDFEEFKNLIMDLEIKTSNNMKFFNDAKNVAKGLFINSDSLLKICPIEAEKANNSPLLDCSKFKENLLMKKSLEAVSSYCTEIITIGDKIKKSTEYENQLPVVEKMVQKIYDHLKIKSVIDVVGETDKNIEMIKLKSQLVDLEKDYSNNFEFNSTNSDTINRFNSSIGLRLKSIDIYKSEIQEIDKQISTMIEEKEFIRSSKSLNNKLFQSRKNDAIEKYNDQMNLDLQKTISLKNKIDEEIKRITSNLIPQKQKFNRKMNFIIIIDKSGSMSSNISIINRAAHDLLSQLKKAHNDSFYFTIIYFDSSSIVTADTIHLNSCNDFNIYLRNSASGGTSYDLAFLALLQIAQRNHNSKIEALSIIFFTDGEDYGNKQASYSYAQQLKSIYRDNTCIYFRGLGQSQFKDTDIIQLNALSNCINENSDFLNCKFDNVSICNDIRVISDFFSNFSASHVNYFKDLEENINSLEKMKSNFTAKFIKFQDDSTSMLTAEMKRLDRMQEMDLKTITDREALTATYDSDLSKLRDLKKEKEQEVCEEERIMKQHELDRDSLKQKDITKLVNEIQTNIIDLKNKIKAEFLKIREIEAENQKKIVAANNKIFQDLGFSLIETYIEFRNLIYEFKEKFFFLESSSTSYATNMSNFSLQMSRYTEHIQDTLKNNRSEEIQKLFDKKGGFDSNEGLGEAVLSHLNMKDADYDRNDVHLVCRKREFLVEVMEQTENKKKFALQKLEATFLKNEKKEREALEDDLTKLDETIAKLGGKSEKDIELIEKDIEKIEEELDKGQKEDETKDKWNQRKLQLKSKKDELKDKIKNNTGSKQEISQLIKEKETKIKAKEDLDKKFNTKKTRLENALEETINTIQMWDRNEIKRRDSVNLKEALGNFKDEYLKIKNE